jgi:hypothetical protein
MQSLAILKDATTPFFIKGHWRNFLAGVFPSAQVSGLRLSINFRKLPIATIPDITTENLSSDAPCDFSAAIIAFENGILIQRIRGYQRATSKQTQLFLCQYFYVAHSDNLKAHGAHLGDETPGHT